MAVYPEASESSLGSTNGFNDDEYARFLAPGTLSNVQKEMIRLFRARQFESVEVLARFEHPKNSYLCGLLLGDCAYEAGNYRQAQHFYRQAVHHDPALFRHKEARCLERQGSLVEATSVLEQISQSDRNFSVLLLLGTLYVRTSRPSIAAETLLQALRLNPYGVEAIEKLANLGTDRTKILEALKQGVAASSSNDARSDPDFFAELEDLVSALCAKHRYHTATAMSLFQKLEASHPNNIYLLQNLANVHLQMNNELSAEFCLERIRYLEEPNIKFMDVYGQLLARADKITALNQLADSLLLHHATRPEAWTALSLYHEVRGNHEKALLFCEKAIAIDSSHPFAHRLRGSILMASHRPAHAAVSFFRAIELQPDIVSYEGLVDAYLLTDKTKEAIASAKEAFFLAPRDPRAMTLVGLALLKGAVTGGAGGRAKSAVAVEKAKKSLHKAIDIEPGFLRPLFALVDVYSEAGDYETCVDLLQKGLNGSTASQDKLLGHGLMLCRLGEMYMILDKLQKAMDCFNRALGLNPDLQIAQRSLERLEKQIRDEVSRSPGGQAPRDPSSSSPDDDDDAAIHDTPSNDSTQSGHYHNPASRGAGGGAMHRSSYGYLPSSSYSLFHSSPS